MAEFLGFGQTLRPDIGLLVDQNLSEIYASDQPLALRNIRLDPEVLDVIYDLSKVISKEDLRASSGLSTLLLSTLDIQEETLERINYGLYDQLDYISTRNSIGKGALGSEIRLDNVFIYNGSIQCKGVKYKVKTLGDSLTSGGVTQISYASSSRASLFNSEKYGQEVPDRVGYLKTATSPFPIRVRRRSRVHSIALNPGVFVKKPSVSEQPSHTILCHIGSKDSNGNLINTAYKFLATKNSPLKIPCRMSVGTITIVGFGNIDNVFFGYQVQNIQSKGANDTPKFLNIPQNESKQIDRITITIDVTKTGYQDAYDLLLYLYLKPDQIRSISFSGINISEFPDGKDIGLIGFDSLESLTLRGTSIKTPPLWLKTRNSTLRELNISADGDNYVNGRFRYFDYRNSTETPSSSTPLYTFLSYLSSKKKGAFLKEDLSWNGSFESYIKTPDSFYGSTSNYREFSVLTTLSIGDRLFGINPRLNKVFPNLQNLTWVGRYDRAPLSGGHAPKIANNGQNINYNIALSGAGGTLVDIGTSTTPGNQGHIGKYKFDTFVVSGDATYRIMPISGTIAPNAEVANWTNWFDTTSVIGIYASNVSINLQPTGYKWSRLASLDLSYSGGAVFAAANGNGETQPIKAPNLISISLYGSGSSGPIPSLGSNVDEDSIKIKSVEYGGNSTVTAITDSSITAIPVSYILPKNYATSPDIDYSLESFSIADSPISGRFRSNDFEKIKNIRSISLVRTGNISGVFPKIPDLDNPTNNSKDISVFMSVNATEAGSACKIYDLSNLSITPANLYISRDLVELNTSYLNFGNGGCRLPALDGSSDSRIRTLRFDGNLPTQYPSGWVGSVSSGCILDSDPSTTLSGLTPGSVQSTLGNGEQINYIKAQAGVDLTKRILVNDIIFNGQNELGRVLSVTPEVAYVSNLINPSITTLTFKRSTQSINQWFKSGYKDISVISMSGCRLSGNINLSSPAGFKKLTYLDLSGNCLDGYESGGLTKIFTESNRTIKIYLNNNNLNREAIRSILKDLLPIALNGVNGIRFTDVSLDLKLTKLSSSSKNYINFTSSEIFDTTIVTAPSQKIGLSRNVTIKRFTTKSITNPSTGITTDVTTEDGTRVVSVPGAYISSASPAGIYRTRVDAQARYQEDPLGTSLRSVNSSQWKIDLGFTYNFSSSGTFTTGSSYEDSITKAQSYSLAGINPSHVVNDPAP